MILFAFSVYEATASDLEQRIEMRRGCFFPARFPNHEMHVTLGTPVTGQTCVVLGSIALPDEQMLSTLLLCHTLKKEGADKVIALLPYLGYARHDKEEPGKSLGVAWVGQML